MVFYYVVLSVKPVSFCLGCAKKLGKAGAHVLLVARGVEKLEQTAEMIRKVGGTATIYPCDLSDLKAIDAMAEQILAPRSC